MLRQLDKIVYIIALLGLVIGFSPAHAAEHYTVTVAQLEARVAEELVAQGAGDSLAATLLGSQRGVIHSSDQPVDIKIQSLHFNTDGMRWDGQIDLYEGDKLAASLPAQGRYENMIAVPILNRRVQHGETITESDIGWNSVAEHRLRKDTVLTAEALINNTPRRLVAEGRPIRLNEIERPMLMEKGAQVQVRFVTTNMEISVVGEALDAGAKGDIVRIRNSDSKTVVRATVTGAGDAEVKQPVQLTQNIENTRISQ